jgi:hypothetical protein
MRLTGSERAVAEIVAVAEHVASLTAAAVAFNVAADVPSPPPEKGREHIAPLDEHSAGETGAVLEEIAEWSRHALRVPYVPVIWRVMAHQPRLLATTWRKDRLVLSAGTVDELVKTCVAMAVAQFRQSTYWISYFTQILRAQHALDDAALVDVAGAVMHYVSFNTIAHGMRLHAPVADITAKDVAPGGPLEHVVPGMRRKAGTGAA